MSATRLLWSVGVGMLLLSGCRPGEVNNQLATQPQNFAAPKAPLIAPPEPPMDREALLLAVIRARSAAAAGIDDRQAQAELDGGRFTFRIRLGCPALSQAEAAPELGAQPDQVTRLPGRAPAAASGAEPEEAPPANFAAVFDAEERRAELRAAPDLALDHPAVAQLAGERFESVEGFWIPDPWLLVPACPLGGRGSAHGPVGLAQFFTADDSRVERRDGRAYEARANLAEGETLEGRSWDLLVSGRLRALDGRAIRCTPAKGEVPACVIAAQFERVAIIDAASGDQVAEWSRG